MAVVLSRIDEFEVDGRRFTLYAGGSYVLFEEDGEGAEGIGAIERADARFLATAWCRPGVTIAADSLPEAIKELIALDGAAPQATGQHT